jgi:hypothetical protein
MSLKDEFAEWFPRKAPGAYTRWFGNNLDRKLDDIDKAYEASFGKSLFDIDSNNIPIEISKMKTNIANRDKAENNTFAEYDNKTSNGIPKAIIQYFIKFLKDDDIPDRKDGPKIDEKKAKKIAGVRFKGNPIGNSQNQLIRNILSNIGDESFTRNDWEEIKKEFNNKCAYCGSEDELEMDHAIPINKEKLGEHKLGNLVPACKICNQNKADEDYREFLGTNIDAINNIEQHMKNKNYIPLGDNDKLRKILNKAHEEVALIAERYIYIISELFMK